MSQVSFACISHDFIHPLTLALASCGLQAEENITALVKPGENPKIAKTLIPIVYFMLCTFRAVVFYAQVLFFQLGHKALYLPYFGHIF